MAQTAQPELERNISSESVRTGVRLLRGTSQLFTGSADGSHHGQDHTAAPAAPTENTPLTAAPAAAARAPLIRQQSQAAMRERPTQDEVQQRIQADTIEMFTRNMKWVVLAAVIFLILMLTMLVVTFLAIYAVVSYHDKPCDQPLKYYLLVLILWSQVPGAIQQFVTDHSWTWRGRLALTVVLAVPDWCIIGWGFYMIQNTETCPKTNPHLYYPTRNYIFVQIVFFAMLLLVSTCMAFGARHFMLYVAHLAEGPGCSNAVRALPKVVGGAPELIAEDGEVKACPICLDALTAGAVTTPCTHYFHEECLANWCGSHLDCPLCRQVVGEPDGDDKV